MLPRRPSIFKCTRLDIKTRGFSTTIAENGSRVSQFGSAKSWPRLSALSSLESSRLPNNLTITTKGVPTKISGFSLCLPAGSRYEPADKGGVAHFLKNSFFMSNKEESALALSRLQELRSAQTRISLSRDSINITVECPVQKLNEALQSVGFMMQPRLLERHEVELVKEMVSFDRDLVYSDLKTFLVDKAHQTAFRGGLGNAVICSKVDADSIGADDILQHFNNSLIRQGASLVGYGVAHQNLVELAKQSLSTNHFARFGTIPQLRPKYFGGETRFEGSNKLNSVVLAFPKFGGIADPTSLLITSIIMNLLIPSQSVKYGNWQSLLLRDASESESNALGSLWGFQQHHSDVSLVGFGLSNVRGESIRDGLKTLREKVGQVQSMLSHDHLESAKTKALLDYFTTLEERPRFMDEASKQIGSAGKPYDSKELLSITESITLSDISKAASDIFAKKPTMVAYGNLRTLPFIDEI